MTDIMVAVFIFGFATGISFTLAVSLIVWSRLVRWATVKETSDFFTSMAKAKRNRDRDANHSQSH